MSGGGVVRSDGIVEVHSDVIEVVRAESHDGNEPSGGAGSALRHSLPFVESAGRAKGGWKNSVRVYG